MQADSVRRCLRRMWSTSVGLYGYLLILNLAVVSISLKKEWRLLNYLAFILTYILFASSGWLQGGGLHGCHDIPRAFLFVIHSSLVFMRCLIGGKSPRCLRFCTNGQRACIRIPGTLAYFRALRQHVLSCGHDFAARGILCNACLCFSQEGAGGQEANDNLFRPGRLFMALTLPAVMDRITLTSGLALLALVYLWIGGK